MATIDFNRLYRFYFGISGQPYQAVRTPADPEAELSSIMGTPIVMPLSLDNVALPNEPLISVTGAKRVITTSVDGHEGTFKELFSKDDYRITIVGIAVNEEEEEKYPEKLVRQLRELAEKPAALKVTNKLLALFNINQLVITDYDFPAVEGGMSFQPYSFQCLSDKTFELEVIEE